MDTDALLTMLPPVTDANRGFWDGSARGELCLPHDDAGTPWFPEAPVDPHTLSTSVTWRAVSGRARLWSWIVMHQRYFPAFADELPYLVAMVELEEGPWMISTIVDPPADLACGDPLAVTFERIGADRVVPAFRVVAR